MTSGFQAHAAKPKGRSIDDAPSQQPMRPSGIRNAPSTDQKRVRRAMQRGIKPKTAAFSDGEQVLVDGKDVATYSGADWLGTPAPEGMIWVEIDGDVVAIQESRLTALAKTAQKETVMSDRDREVQMLQAMAVASLPEQHRIAADLEAMRASRVARLRSEASLDLANTVVQAHTTPVPVYSRHTAATDWVGDLATSEGDPTLTMRTEASLWFNRLSREVRADHEEFVAQAQGYARRVASRHGEMAQQAERAFLDAAAHLHRADRKTADEQNGYGESTITNYEDLNPVTDESMFEDGWAEAGSANKDTGVHPVIPSTGQPTAAKTAESAPWLPRPGERAKTPMGEGTVVEHAYGGTFVVEVDGQRIEVQREKMTRASAKTAAEGYDKNDRCRECGEHIADPHQPGCPNDPDNDDEAKEASRKMAGNPYPVGTPNWFSWESGEIDPDGPGRGPVSGVPRDLFPQGGVPLRGDLTPEQEAWLKSRGSKTAKVDLWALKEGDKVLFVRDGRTTEMTVRREIEQMGAPENRTVSLTLGPGRWSTEVSQAGIDMGFYDVQPVGTTASRTAAAPIVDPDKDNGEAESALPVVEVSTATEPSYPWEQDENTPGSDAADVASVATPGVSGYPQPTAARKTAILLTNIGIEGENGVGTDPSGNRVKFRLSPKDKADLQAILYSDLAINFSGVDVTEDEIIREGSRRRVAADKPEWLRERVNDPYGTPPKHEFWSTVNAEQVGPFRIFEKDGRWYAHHERQNYWMNFGSREEAIAQASGGGTLDMWASKQNPRLAAFRQTIAANLRKQAKETRPDPVFTSSRKQAYEVPYVQSDPSLYESRSAQDAARGGYGGPEYAQMLDRHAKELRDRFLQQGDTARAEEMMTRTLSEALQGNDGD